MRRLVDAWVRMWASSPIWSPCAATEKMSMGPPDSMVAPSADSRTGRTASLSSTSLATASGVSTPNQGAAPGPWLIPAKARAPD